MPPATAPARTVGPPASPTVLEPEQWAPLARAHGERADALTARHRERVARGEADPVEDFLYTYYPTRPAGLARWHPGAGVTLVRPQGAASGSGASDAPGAAKDDARRAGWRWYHEVRLPDGARGLTLDAPTFVAERGPTVRFVRELVARTAARRPRTGCFGLHEWAMVYRDEDQGRATRHPLPLRLGGPGTDAVVEAHRITCTHIDAYRFFTPQAAPLNTEHPTRENQPELEQPGCLHAGMDLYKWATKLGPACPGDLLLDTFELARDIRRTDMQASPYDVTGEGLDAVAIETPAGKAEYVRRQRAFAARGQALRARLVAACDLVLAAADGATAPAASAAPGRMAG